jgi:16S rRNA (adenine1518-N6/adenine1519-N6)-dimethyltransferase
MDGPAVAGRPRAGDNQLMRAKKSLGQHFLVSEGVTEKILVVCRKEFESAEGILEIGPGTGALTGGLAVLGRPFYALEVDYSLAIALQDRFPNLTIILADATELDLADFSKKAGLSPWLVAGNLPYNVGTGILKRILSSPGHVAAAVVMLQREVARKFCAGLGEEGYGVLAAGAAPWWDREMLLTVRPGAFRPQPKVTSAVCLFKPKLNPDLAEMERTAYQALLARAFAHPRKFVAANLARGHRGKDFWSEVLESVGLPANARPNQVSPAGYVGLFLAAS